MSYTPWQYCRFYSLGLFYRSYIYETLRASAEQRRASARRSEAPVETLVEAPVVHRYKHTYIFFRSGLSWHLPGLSEVPS